MNFVSNFVMYFLIIPALVLTLQSPGNATDFNVLKGQMDGMSFKSAGFGAKVHWGTLKTFVENTLIAQEIGGMIQADRLETILTNNGLSVTNHRQLSDPYSRENYGKLLNALNTYHVSLQGKIQRDVKAQQVLAEQAKVAAEKQKVVAEKQNVLLARQEAAAEKLKAKQARKERREAIEREKRLEFRFKEEIKKREEAAVRRDQAFLEEQRKAKEALRKQEQELLLAKQNQENAEIELEKLKKNPSVSEAEEKRRLQKERLLKAEIQQTKEIAERAQLDLVNLEKKFKKHAKQKDSIIADLEGELDDIEGELSDLSKTLKEAQLKEEQASAALKKAEAELEMKKLEEKFREKMVSPEEVSRIKRANREEIKKIREAHKAHNNKLVIQVERLRKSAQEADLKAQKVTSQLERVKTLKLEVSGELEKAKRQLEDLERENLKLKSAEVPTNIKEELASLKGEVLRLKEANDNTQEKLTDAESRANAAEGRGKILERYREKDQQEMKNLKAQLELAMSLLGVNEKEEFLKKQKEIQMAGKQKEEALRQEKLIKKAKGKGGLAFDKEESEFIKKHEIKVGVAVDNFRNLYSSEYVRSRLLKPIPAKVDIFGLEKAGINQFARDLNKTFQSLNTDKDFADFYNDTTVLYITALKRLEKETPGTPKFVNFVALINQIRLALGRAHARVMDIVINPTLTGDIDNILRAAFKNFTAYERKFFAQLKDSGSEAVSIKFDGYDSEIMDIIQNSKLRKGFKDTEYTLNGEEIDTYSKEVITDIGTKQKEEDYTGISNRVRGLVYLYSQSISDGSAPAWDKDEVMLAKNEEFAGVLIKLISIGIGALNTAGFYEDFEFDLSTETEVYVEIRSIEQKLGATPVASMLMARLDGILALIEKESVEFAEQENFEDLVGSLTVLNDIYDSIFDDLSDGVDSKNPDDLYDIKQKTLEYLANKTNAILEAVGGKLPKEIPEGYDIGGAIEDIYTQSADISETFPGIKIPEGLLPEDESSSSDD